MIKLIDTTIGNILKERSEKRSTSSFITETVNNNSITYGEFAEKTDIIARAMLGTGMKKGDHIGIMCENGIRYVEIVLAAAKVGIVVVPINVNYYVSEISRVLRHADVKVLFMDSCFRAKQNWELVQQVWEERNDDLMLEKVVLADDRLSDDIAVDFVRWNAFTEYSSETSDEEMRSISESVTSDDLYAIMYTSGTTAEPKGVMLRQYAVINSCRYAVHGMGMDESEKLCTPLPLFTTFGTVVAILTTLIAGAHLLTIDCYTPQKMLYAVEKYKATMMMGVPTMFINMINLPEFANYDHSSAKKAVIGGAISSEALIRDIHDSFGLEYITGIYGMTEMSCGCTISLRDTDKRRQLTTVGKSFDNMVIRVVDENNNAVPVGMVGEIVTKGYHVMKGYYKDPEMTAKTIDSDGWLHSGDLGYVDEEGYFTIIGRKKHIIIKGGYNIAPDEISEKIEEYDGVIVAEVVGVKDKVYGEEIAAFVQTSSDDIDLGDVRSSLFGKIAKYKIPKYFFRVDAFEYSPGGKVQKFKLEKLAMGLVKKGEGIC